MTKRMMIQMATLAIATVLSAPGTLADVPPAPSSSPLGGKEQRGKEGHGADAVAIEFKAIGASLLKIFATSESKAILPEVDLACLSSELLATRVRSAPEPVKDYLGNPKDLVTYIDETPKRSQIDSTRWNRLSFPQKMMATAHELFVYCGLEKSDDYGISMKVFQIGTDPSNLVLFNAVENERMRVGLGLIAGKLVSPYERLHKLFVEATLPLNPEKLPELEPTRLDAEYSGPGGLKEFFERQSMTCAESSAAGDTLSTLVNRSLFRMKRRFAVDPGPIFDEAQASYPVLHPVRGADSSESLKLLKEIPYQERFPQFYDGSHWSRQAFYPSEIMRSRRAGDFVVYEVRKYNRAGVNGPGSESAVGDPYLRAYGYCWNKK